MSQTRMKLPEALRGAYAAARRARWSVTRTANGHLKWVPPGGGTTVITGGTPDGGRHATANALTRLRKAGLKC